MKWRSVFVFIIRYRYLYLIRSVVAVFDCETIARKAPAARVRRTRGTCARSTIRPVVARTVVYFSTRDSIPRNTRVARSCRASRARSAVWTILPVVASTLRLGRTAVACCRINVHFVAVLAGAERTRHTRRGACVRARVRPGCAVRACRTAGAALVFSGDTRGAHARVRVPCVAEALALGTTAEARRARVGRTCRAARVAARVSVCPR